MEGKEGRMRKVLDFFHKQSMRAYMATTIVLLGLAYFFISSFVKIPKENHDTVILVTGYMFGLLTTVVSYYFGSIKKEDTKNS